MTQADLRTGSESLKAISQPWKTAKRTRGRCSLLAIRKEFGKSVDWLLTGEI